MSLLKILNVLAVPFLFTGWEAIRFFMDKDVTPSTPGLLWMLIVWAAWSLVVARKASSDMFSLSLLVPIGLLVLEGLIQAGFRWLGLPSMPFILFTAPSSVILSLLILGVIAHRQLSKKAHNSTQVKSPAPTA